MNNINYIGNGKKEQFCLDSSLVYLEKVEEEINIYA